MKKLFLAIILLTGFQSVNAQVFSGTQEIEKANKEVFIHQLLLMKNTLSSLGRLNWQSMGKLNLGKVLPIE